MEIEGYEFVCDSISKFFKSIHIEGWFRHSNDSLAAVNLVCAGLIHAECRVGIPSPGLGETDGPASGFRIDALRDSDQLDADAALQFVTASGWTRTVGLLALSADRWRRYASARLMQQFTDAACAKPGTRVLDLGGRARSKLDRRHLFGESLVTVFDILPGENVDVVGDAHEISAHFPQNHFDAVYSGSVFEHLLMPWKVVIEINKVLKPGAIGLIATHQTIGLHDAPWDFWRFSDTAWASLFNSRTGFEIIGAGLDYPQYVIPFVYRRSKHDAERSAGFEASTVLVSKIGACELEWPVSIADVTATTYPIGEDGFDPGLLEGWGKASRRSRSTMHAFLHRFRQKLRTAMDRRPE